MLSFIWIDCRHNHLHTFASNNKISKKLPNWKFQTHNQNYSKDQRNIENWKREMVQAISTSSFFNILFSKSHRSTPPHSLHRFNHYSPSFAHRISTGVQRKAVELPLPETVTQQVQNKEQRKTQFAIENLTSWLLKQELAGNIDAELTVVLSSISLACKQIASLLQRSSIINLTGGQGTINVQGEDQKKLDVISNEVSLMFPMGFSYVV